MTIKELADELGVSKPTVAKAIDELGIKPRKVSNRFDLVNEDCDKIKAEILGCMPKKKKGMIKMSKKTLSEQIRLLRAEETWKKFFDAANIFVVEKKISIECGTNIFGEKEIVTPEFYVPNCTGRCENIFLTFDEHTADVLFRLNMPAMILPCTLSLFEDADGTKEAAAIFGDICAIGDNNKTFNCFYIDGDWFGCAPLVLTSPEGKGVLSLCGSDTSYYECDEKATEHAYTEAGKVFRNHR